MIYRISCIYILRTSRAYRAIAHVPLRWEQRHGANQDRENESGSWRSTLSRQDDVEGRDKVEAVEANEAGLDAPGPPLRHRQRRDEEVVRVGTVERQRLRREQDVRLGPERDHARVFPEVVSRAVRCPREQELDRVADVRAAGRRVDDHLDVDSADRVAEGELGGTREHG